MHNVRKKLIISLLIAFLVLSATSCDKAKTENNLSSMPQGDMLSGMPQGDMLSGYGLSAAVLYDGKADSATWADTYEYLNQSTLVGLKADALDIQRDFKLDKYQILYVDESIAVAGAKKLDKITDQVMRFTEAGGYVVLANHLYTVFDRSFIGASDYRKVTQCPLTLDFPNLGDDFGELQEILSDFATLYTSYADIEVLAAMDYGYAVVCDTAMAIAEWDGSALYTVNQYGDGFVFFTNPLLPNFFSISGFDMLEKNESQLPFSNTTASCNQLLVNAFAGFASKQLHGYYIGRVFGSFGATDMAWELHHEEISGLANNSMEIFTELCKEYLQVPSFTLIRNAYTWYLRSESVTYYLGESEGKKTKYALDLYENAYSSGTHIAAGDEWLSLGNIEDSGSFWNDYPEYDYRAYPALCDYNGDGIVDLFCGSCDGNLYYYEGQSFDSRLCVSEAQVLTDGAGNPLSVGSYSAPKLADIDGDGYPDIICGSVDGNIYWFSGNGSLVFEPQGILLNTDIPGQCLPAIGDLNGDGVNDIAVGSNEGILVVFYGVAQEDGSVAYSHQSMEGISARCANADLGLWLAPEIVEANGAVRLAVGTFDGYIALFDRDKSGMLSFSGYVETDEMNYKGNYRIKTGSNCVPVFYDINGDGAMDLVCGALEYGLAYPIDSEYFPYAEELKQQVQYAADNEFYLSAHFYTQLYSSEAREAQELRSHIDALNYYGLDVSGLGTNQHTWKLSTHSLAQSLLSEWNMGLLWNSGFTPVGSANEPNLSAENVVTMPFFLTSDGEPTILVQNCSVLPYRSAEWTDITGKYGVPVCIYYHCDFVYESDESARSYLESVADFWWQHGCNFVCEDQLMTATAAAYNLTVNVEGGLSDTGSITLTPGASRTDFPLYHEAYQNSSGAKIVFAEWVDTQSLSIDADVWKLDGSTLYLGLNRVVSVSCGGRGEQTADADSHILRVNVAAEIVSSESGAEITFLDGGMMQVVVSGEASTPKEGWTVTAKDGCTIFTKYGAADNLEIIYEYEMERTL